MKHLLVTNDFPPKVGGIQQYLWELWRRLPPESTTVMTTRYRGAPEFDAAQPFRIVRDYPVLLPFPRVHTRAERLAEEVGADLVVLDPALPIGAIGRHLDRPFVVIVHGAEITVPARLPVTRALLRRAIEPAAGVIAAGDYVARELRELLGDRLPPTTVVPPGVDCDRFVPLDIDELSAARARFGVAEDAKLVVSLSRLVPRKGMDVLIRAAASLAAEIPKLVVLIGGKGRDNDRLEQLIDELNAPVRLMGRVDDEELPAFYGCADVFAMLCRNRWGGLEQEGFGIVFLEAAACGVPQVAGRSGGSHEAVAHEETGLVVDDPSSVSEVAGALRRLLLDEDVRARMGKASRLRTEREFTYDVLIERLSTALAAASVVAP